MRLPVKTIVGAEATIQYFYGVSWSSGTLGIGDDGCAFGAQRCPGKVHAEINCQQLTWFEGLVIE